MSDALHYLKRREFWRFTDWRYWLAFERDGIRYPLYWYVAKALHTIAIKLAPEVWDCCCESPHCEIDQGRPQICMDHDEGLNELRIKAIRIDLSDDGRIEDLTGPITKE